MDKAQHIQHSCLAVFLALLALCYFSNATALTLNQAETEALSQSHEIKSIRANSAAFKQKAVADGQLSDPMLMLNAMNVPVNTFSLSQEAMTQIQVGVEQTFPKGRSLHYKSEQTEAMSRAESEKALATKAEILQNVRIAWFNLYYWIEAREIVYKQIKIFKHLVKVTESMLGSNKALQMDVVRAQLELSDLENKVIEINQQIDTVRSKLARWIGPTMARDTKQMHLPNWKNPPNINALQETIKYHPTLRAEREMSAAALNGMKWAEQQYIPGFTVSLAYGFRQGHNDNGSARPDFLTAQVNMDLPIFTANRQNKTFESNQETYLSSEQNTMIRYRELSEILSSQYAAWRNQRKSAMLFRHKLIPEAKQYAEATLTAYQNAKTDFPTLARAYIRELNSELNGLKASVNQRVARANLLYLEGK